MSDQNDHRPVRGADVTTGELEALFAAARGQPPAPLPAALLTSLQAAAADAQPVPRPRQIAKPSALAAIWSGLQEIFGGKQGVAGAVLASCAAFAFGIFAPDTASGLIGLTGSVELAALELDADPAVLWAEE